MSILHERVKQLVNSSGAVSGAISVNTNWGKKYYGTLVGNVTLTLTGFNNGEIVSLWLTQDATAGRTLTINPASGGANVVLGPDGAISAVAAKTSKVVIAKISNVYYIEITAQP